MQLTNALFTLTAAVAVTAHPSMQAHRHQHAKKSPAEFFKAVNRQEQDVATTTTTSSAAATSTTAASTDETSEESTGTGDFGSCEATSQYAVSKKRATLSEITYEGELGSPYGCNWLEIDEADASLYDYTLTFESPDYEITCQCWNKIGPDHESTGQWQDMLKLSLAKGSTTVVALMADTQGSCGCGYGSSVPQGEWGDWLGTWVEMDMGSGVNDGQSGADVSALAVMDDALNYGSTHEFPGMKLFANDDYCSGMTANAAEYFDAYVLGNDADDGTEIHDVDGLGCTGYTTNNLRVLIGDVSL